MKIRQRGGRVLVTDNPTPFWLFYASFVLGGIVAIYLSLWEPTAGWQALIGTCIGIGNIAGGLYMIAREPGSRVEIDAVARRVRVVRWGIAGRRETVRALDDLVDVDVETTEHSDDGAVYRPRLRFAAARDIPVSVFWYQREASSKAVVAALRAISGGARGSNL